MAHGTTRRAEPPCHPVILSEQFVVDPQPAVRSPYSGAISHPAGAGESAWYFTLRRGSAISGSTASRHVA